MPYVARDDSLRLPPPPIDWFKPLPDFDWRHYWVIYFITLEHPDQPDRPHVYYGSATSEKGAYTRRNNPRNASLDPASNSSLSMHTCYVMEQGYRITNHGAVLRLPIPERHMHAPVRAPVLAIDAIMTLLTLQSLKSYHFGTKVFYLISTTASST